MPLYDRYLTEVEEVLALAVSGKILAGNAAIYGDWFVMVTDLDIAHELYTTQEVETEYRFVDILENESAASLGEWAALGDTAFGEEYGLKQQVVSRLVLPEQFWMIREDVSAFLGLCISSRGVYGKTNVFFEQWFKAFELGGWPCGWVGDYPAGKLMVYFPTADSPPKHNCVWAPRQRS